MIKQEKIYLKNMDHPIWPKKEKYDLLVIWTSVQIIKQ